MIIPAQVRKIIKYNYYFIKTGWNGIKWQSYKIYIETVVL